MLSIIAETDIQLHDVNCPPEHMRHLQQCEQQGCAITLIPLQDFNIVNQAIDFVSETEANLNISALTRVLKIEVTSENSTLFSSIVQFSKWPEAAAVEENLEVKMSVIEAFV